MHAQRLDAELPTLAAAVGASRNRRAPHTHAHAQGPACACRPCQGRGRGQARLTRTRVALLTHTRAFSSPDCPRDTRVRSRTRTCADAPGPFKLRISCWTRSASYTGRSVETTARSMLRLLRIADRAAGLG
eukprot:5268668-Pleurochrysis_carterae.AAC.1